jgi:hypothetical protein
MIPFHRPCRIYRNDRQRHGLRNLIERFINWIKNYRRQATEYDNWQWLSSALVQIATALLLSMNIHSC